jgi:hypothetical protein
MVAKARGTYAHEEEVAELQRRFNALAEQRKTASENPASVLTRDLNVSRLAMSKSAATIQPRERRDVEGEMRRLDAQIIELRKRHDSLHHSNSLKRREIDGLADKLKELHMRSSWGDDKPQQLLAEMEQKLLVQAKRYEEAHRTRLTCEHIIDRLKRERLEYTSELKAIESTLSQKEAEYEQLLLMSHEANMSKEVAKQEFSKFEALVGEERKLREKELQQRRQMLQKKQELALELEQKEKERRAALLDSANRNGDDSFKAQAEAAQQLIEAEEAKIRAYEAAFSQIKEATGVADVNEVIQKFLTQEETHQSLQQMTAECQSKVEGLRARIAAEKAEVSELQYALAGLDQGVDPNGPTGRSDAAAAARAALEKGRQRWRKVWRTHVNVKAAVQHLIDTLDTLKLDDEMTEPLTDHTLIPHLAQIEKKLALIAQAFLEESDRHAELLTTTRAPPVPDMKRPNSRPSTGLPHREEEEEEDDQEEAFEEELEEDVLDRDSLKQSALALLDKQAKKGKKKKKRSPAEEDKARITGTSTSKAMAFMA